MSGYTRRSRMKGFKGFFLLCSAHATLNAGQTEYAILFDAGSSGTRMEIYWFMASGPLLQASEITELSPDPDKGKPGISDLVADPSQVEA